MGKNIIVCCDGTSNQFGENNTNVIRLVQCLDRTPGYQRLYYDPGVGTLPEPGARSAIKKKISLLIQQAFGMGLATNVQEAYTYLMDFWEPGDEVFLFGFSRGAYTVRVLAGLLHELGLLPRGNYNLVPYVWHMYKSMRHGAMSSKAKVADYQKLCAAFRRTFSREPYTEDQAKERAIECFQKQIELDPADERRFPVKFMGIWDCVSSVGWVYNPTTFPGTRRNTSLRILRHAISIDERRAFFKQNLMKEVTEDGFKQDFKQYWFPGVHADVGGGYPETEGDLWKEPFKWIVSEAANKGLRIRDEEFRTILSRPKTPLAFQKQIHKSLEKWWYLGEIVPKPVGVKGFRLRCNFCRFRQIEDESFVHRSAFGQEYTTKHLPAEFLAQQLADDVDGEYFRA